MRGASIGASGSAHIVDCGSACSRASSSGSGRCGSSLGTSPSVCAQARVVERVAVPVVVILVVVVMPKSSLLAAVQVLAVVVA